MSDLPEPIDLLSAELTSTPFAARNRGPYAALAEFMYFETLADAASYAAGHEVFILDRRSGTWTRRGKQVRISDHGMKSSTKKGYLSYHDIHVDPHALRTGLTGRQARPYSVKVDNTWRASDTENIYTVKALLAYLNHEQPPILKDLHGRTIDLVYTEDGTYTFAVTVPGLEHHPPLTLLGDWNELRHLGNSDLAGIDALIAVASEAVLVANILTEDLSHRTSVSAVLSAERVTHVLRTIEQLDQAIANGSTATCRECSKDLPDDSECEFATDRKHDPGQVLWKPDINEKDFRKIDVEFSVRVPNDGYDYATDATGRLGQMLTLLRLHPLVSDASTRTGARAYAGSRDDESDARPVHGGRTMIPDTFCCIIGVIEWPEREPDVIVAATAHEVRLAALPFILTADLHGTTHFDSQDNVSLFVADNPVPRDLNNVKTLKEWYEALKEATMQPVLIIFGPQRDPVEDIYAWDRAGDSTGFDGRGTP
jgi:hypothetical protein